MRARVFYEETCNISSAGRHCACFWIWHTHLKRPLMPNWVDDAIFDFAALPVPQNGKDQRRAFFADLFVGFPDSGTTEARVLGAGSNLSASPATSATIPQASPCTWEIGGDRDFGGHTYISSSPA